MARPQVTAWQFLDERHPGGRPRALLFLTHPGPSMLVTAVVVGAAASLARDRARLGATARAAFIVLPSQLATGALNDWADATRDCIDKPFKPIARGLVSRRVALSVAMAGYGTSVAVGARGGRRYALIALLGGGSGAAYDLGFKRTPASVLCWWGGFEAVVLLATTAAGAPPATATWPLAALLAVALHVANALPDEGGDRRSGTVTLPVVLGVRRSRLVMVGTLAAAAAHTRQARSRQRQGDAGAHTSHLLAAAAVGTAVAPLAALRRVGFPVLALLSGAAAVSWLRARPVTAGG